MKTKIILSFLTVVFLTLAWSCKDSDSNGGNNDVRFRMRISDPRKAQTESLQVGKISTKTLLQEEGKIIDPEKLTQFELTISGIYVRDISGNVVNVLSSPLVIDLREFRGEVSRLIPEADVPEGNYSTLIINLSGFSLTYDGNNLTASTTQNPVFTLEGGTVFDLGIPNPFTAAGLSYEIPIDLQLASANEVENVRLFIDSEASCEEIETDIPDVGTVYFVNVRGDINVSLLLEEDIQLIYHTSPLGIQPPNENDDVNYYILHTFVDFAEVGGTINSHSSQHVFRGDDGDLLVNAEDLEINESALSTNTINATGETEVRADEVFKTSTIKTNLQALGHELLAGETYYFSLRKTWNITSNGVTYDLTRVGEPLPVQWPQ